MRKKSKSYQIIAQDVAADRRRIRTIMKSWSDSELVDQANKWCEVLAGLRKVRHSETNAAITFYLVRVRMIDNELRKRMLRHDRAFITSHIVRKSSDGRESSAHR